jgi:hypothetical protein
LDEHIKADNCEARISSYVDIHLNQPLLQRDEALCFKPQNGRNIGKNCLFGL